MTGLFMLPNFLEMILDGTKTYDAREYDTKRRGTIALIDSKKNEIVGVIDLVGTHIISAEEYILWHMNRNNYLHMMFLDKNKPCYAYDFKNPKRLAYPVKISRTSKTAFIQLDDKIKESFYFQNGLFD